jgi:glycosyltransferase involved in cell wall biosynthesis
MDAGHPAVDSAVRLCTGPTPTQGYPGGVTRLAILAPFSASAVRGNSVTVQRVARGLREHGVDLQVWDAAAADEASTAREVETYRPVLIHAFHAERTGPLALRLARRLEVPLIVTLTGTDANHDLLDPERAPTVRRVLEGATVITAFHASVVEHVTAVLPDTRERFAVVPQAARFPGAEPFDLAERWSLPPDRLLFVLPAGIRPVKAPRLPLAPLDRLAAADSRVRLAYVGPELDAAEVEALRREVTSRPWAHLLGEVPHRQMASLYAQADVVLNCSISEGGMANAVLEALALARAVLASDIPGNRALVTHDVTGLLFHDAHDLAIQAARLAAEPKLRARLGRSGRMLVEREFSASREIDGYQAVYRRAAPVVSV